MRAQNLMRPCAENRHPSRAVNHLAEGKHLDRGVMLAVRPRRVARYDVMNDLWAGMSCPEATREVVGQLR